MKLAGVQQPYDTVTATHSTGGSIVVRGSARKGLVVVIKVLSMGAGLEASLT